MTGSPGTTLELGVLVLAPTSRDTRLTCGILADAGVVARGCADLDEVARAVEDGAGAALVTEEALLADRSGRFTRALATQPPWSDIPVLVLVRSGEDHAGARMLEAPGNITLLDRPVRILTMVSAVRSALRARTRQYQIRGHLEDRGRSEAALAESEARYRAVGEAIPFGAWVADAGGRFQYLSDAFLRLLGLEAEEACRDGWFHRLPADERDRAEAEWRRAIAAGRMFGHEVRVAGAEGDSRHVLVRGVPLRDREGRITSWVGMNLDVTDRRRIEEDLDRVGRLDSIAVLASGIAHDFNNILTAVVANVSLASRLLPAGEPAAARLDAALKAGAHAQKVVRQLLTFARGGAPVRRVIDLPQVMRDAVDFALQGASVRADLAFPDDLWPVEADAAQIAQVIQNLVINGVQAMPEGGLVRVGAHNLEVPDGAPLPGRYVVVSVTDTGAGIDPVDLPRVFDPFFTRKPGGSGLGLATAHSIVQRHGGHISVRSEPGRGTTVQFRLPASAGTPEVSATPRRTAAGRVGRVGRVLLMDDDEAVRDVAHAALVHLGYEADLAVDGAQAIALFTQALEAGRPYDVVILDLTVPGGMGGREAIAHLRTLAPDVRAIVASGYSNDPVMADHAAFGFRAAVDKPYDVDALGVALERVLERARA
ncbi:MAG: ATP-binding protein [Myxococcota bacterium]